jgi:hypothetical protein
LLANFERAEAVLFSIWTQLDLARSLLLNSRPLHALEPVTTGGETGATDGRRPVKVTVVGSQRCPKIPYAIGSASLPP